ncbi:Site-specific DNA recombinase [Chitinophaga terrae (ex Kim and Jung 2007)]|uniref:Site-specific DNA recombinase n=2 Tax=Chitinophaga terrae (ex Kim and Jung 2007) TaxID=408074 RepID=A0A1H4GV26_9BACT|nr:recombinase family protein [Chitinophaga terrae (ex Kim and Jung 2007)]SEB12482.1 Site-specific DNA recombinase [Chitinophaga terrae (ex Kim and Jung 2007)]
MQNAIIYTRVSTDEQAAFGYSLEHQLETLEKYCTINKINVIKHYQEDYSGKDFNRPEWNKLMGFIKENKGLVNTILFTKWDRFTRDIHDTFTVISHLQKLGVSVNSIEQPLDLSNPDNIVMLSFYVSIGHAERLKIGIRTKDGMRAMRKQGKWAGTAPFGYKYHREDARNSTLVKDDEKSGFIVDAFKIYATGLYSIPEVQKMVTLKHNLKRSLTKQAFINILKNKVYAGYIKISATPNEDEHYAKALFEPLIDEDLYNKVQQIMKGRKRTKNVRYQDQRHPLRGFLKCPECLRNMTSSAVKGKRFAYYQCQHGHRRYNALVANEQFENLLSQTFDIDDNIITCYQNILEKTFDRNGANVKSQIKKLNAQIEDYKQKLENKEDDYINERLPAEAYYSVRKKLNNHINELINQKTILEGNQKYQFRNYLAKTTTLLRNLSGVYTKSDVDVKRKILGVILEDKLVFENNTYQTPKFTPAVDVLLRL